MRKKGRYHSEQTEGVSNKGKARKEEAAFSPRNPGGTGCAMQNLPNLGDQKKGGKGMSRGWFKHHQRNEWTRGCLLGQKPPQKRWEARRPLMNIKKKRKQFGRCTGMRKKMEKWGAWGKDVRGKVRG